MKYPKNLSRIYLLDEIMKIKMKYNKNMILSKLKGFNLQTDIQIFDAKHLKTNDILINLYMDEKDELLNDKNAMKELADYLN